MTKCNKYQFSFWLFVRVALIVAVVVNCQLSLIREIPHHHHCRLTHTKNSPNHLRSVYKLKLFSAMQRALLRVRPGATSHQLSCKTGSGGLKESRVNTLKCVGIRGIIKSVLMFPSAVIIKTVRSYVAQQQGSLIVL